MQKSLNSLCLLALLGIFGGGLMSCGSQGLYEEEITQRSVSAQKVKAPSFVVEDLEGQKISLSDFKGKVLFLDFWATWCPPCIVSSPEVEKVAQEYKDKDVAVLSVSLDVQEDMVRRFVKKHGEFGQIAMVNDSDIAETYQVQGIPRFVVIDKEGYITASWVGYHPSFKKIWRKELDRLINA